ncbi:uncharacterized protein LOC119828225 [Zerene cesonia]|uniref:uncharacterized protein LOC119828225 n=1 Tax=Zerene cesonia TaxID=33412 RepID=UPI0018E55FF5|nr:uncharacterized protein LOC119828225 [Zerene cesonia]
MNSPSITRPLVPGSPASPGYGSSHGNGGAGGAKNHRMRSGYHSRRPLALVTYNARTLRTDEKIIELEVELSKLRWDVIGLSEVRRQGEDTITLTSGNLFFFREGDQQSQGGIGFIVHKSLINNIVSIKSVSSRVAYLILRISKRYSMKVIQVYAPTSTHPDEEVEAMYEDISRAIHSSKTHFNVVMGDFNAKLGERGDGMAVVTTTEPTAVGSTQGTFATATTPAMMAAEGSDPDPKSQAATVGWTANVDSKATAINWKQKTVK